MFRRWRRVNEIPRERPGGETCCFAIERETRDAMSHCGGDERAASGFRLANGLWSATLCTRDRSRNLLRSRHFFLRPCGVNTENIASSNAERALDADKRNGCVWERAASSPAANYSAATKREEKVSRRNCKQRTASLLSSTQRS